MSYILEADEGVLLKQNGVFVSGDLDIKYGNAMLTSKYIVLFEESHDDGEEYEVARLPLCKLRFFQNKPQIIIAGDSLDQVMEVYFDDMTLKIMFDFFRSSKRREAYQKWIDSICDLVNSGVIKVEDKSNTISYKTVKVQKNFCMNCGQRIEIEGYFCMNCGAKL